jgi:ring-1,2-phenylacetyl-CoA epoxidase subunit PaaD
MVSRDAVLEVLRTINDPEMPISIVDLGIVEAVRIEQHPSTEANQAARVSIDLLPTFVGCPALHAIEEEIRRKVGALGDVSEVAVRIRYDPAWTVDRISAAGREALKQIGVTVPRHEDRTGVPDSSPQCPFCGSSSVRLESPFGPTRCRMIYYCEACQNPFEHLKKVGPPLLTIDLPGSV